MDGTRICAGMLMATLVLLVAIGANTLQIIALIMITASAFYAYCRMTNKTLFGKKEKLKVEKRKAIERWISAANTLDERELRCEFAASGSVDYVYAEGLRLGYFQSISM